jgi:hypothetical protein
MGAPWNRRESEAQEMAFVEPLAPERPLGVLESSELDLLRTMPDYDAEEMATVRPPGGWPPLATPPSAACAPARGEPAAVPVWTPPNRVEPPGVPVWTPPNRAEITLPSAGSEPVLAPTIELEHRFPEERTLALMAEDLLGRPLDEPEASPSRETEPGRTFSGTAATHGGDLWDQVMPLVSEG